MPFTTRTRQVTQALLPWQFVAIHGCLNALINYGMFSMQGEGKEWPQALILPSALFLALANSLALWYLPVKLSGYEARLAQRQDDVATLERGGQLFFPRNHIRGPLTHEEAEQLAQQRLNRLLSLELWGSLMPRSLVNPMLSFPLFLIIVAPHLDLALSELPILNLTIGSSVTLFLQIGLSFMASVPGLPGFTLNFAEREPEDANEHLRDPFSFGR